MPSTTPLPTILCLHGHGTSGDIFRLQSRRIVLALEKSFRFVFIDAPIESLPGPGVAPVFSELGPFWRWHYDRAMLDNINMAPDELDAERRTTRELLGSHVDRINRNSGEGGVAGVMAFSQGTRVATGLLLDAELGRNITFAIIICATFPILAIDQSQAVIGTASGTVAQKLGIPSIHLHGSYDPWHAEGVLLKQTYYEEKLASSIKFKGGHQVPTGKEEAEEVASWVRDMWKRRAEFTLA